MPLITITERDTNQAEIAINRRGRYEASLSQPFNEEEQARLTWYFEEYVKERYFNHVRAEEVVASLQLYGTRLFEQLFANRVLYGQYAMGAATVGA